MMVMDRQQEPDHAMTTIDRSQRHHFLSVDFVTARTVADCQECLIHCSQVASQSLTLNEDGSFAIKRVVIAGERPNEVKFWGTLEPARRGTWVWGTVIEVSSPRRDRQVYSSGIVAVVLAVIAADGLLRGAHLVTTIAGLLLLAVGVIAVWLWQGRHHDALQVVNWVYETLYIPPDRES
jgi:hypothetical protein